MSCELPRGESKNLVSYGYFEALRVKAIKPNFYFPSKKILCLTLLRRVALPSTLSRWLYRSSIVFSWSFCEEFLLFLRFLLHLSEPIVDFATML